MEPKISSPNTPPESGPSEPQLEQQDIVVEQQEIASQTAHPEKQPARQEKVGENTPKAAPPQQVATTVAAPPQPVNNAVTAVQDDNSAPSVAADDDNIEKEWVDKAKSIIAETKSDPYLQEEKVSKLQADYLQKRYNKKVKLNSD
ncbi:hypothetical protein KC939_02830 [Candidatus Saccharibacteria bacterium]|nr:hypothetical protein [Candidatus Saccharibacteria bacterium]